MRHHQATVILALVVGGIVFGIIWLGVRNMDRIAAWCVAQGMGSASMRGMVVCLDSDRRVILPPPKKEEQ